MKSTLKPGLKRKFSFAVPENKTVPHLYPEAPSFKAMPEVFATGFMVGLFEWVCTELLAEHLDAGEGSLGTHVDFSHDAATPPGMTVTVDAEVIEVEGPKVRFRVSGHDGIEKIGGGEHERFVVKWDKFNLRVAEKAKRARTMAGADS
jgi:fluoroacetyl-CoA thioesterase